MATKKLADDAEFGDLLKAVWSNPFGKILLVVTFPLWIWMWLVSPTIYYRTCCPCQGKYHHPKCPFAGIDGTRARRA